MAKDCKNGKAWVHCGEINDHHRSLCKKKFATNVSNVHLTEEIEEFSEGTAWAGVEALVSSGEMVLMQTSKAVIKSPNNSEVENVRILLDSGSQRTYVTKSLAYKLKLKRESEEKIKLITIGSDKPKTVKTTQTQLSIKLNNGEYLQVSANIVPIISGTVQRKAIKFHSSKNLVHLVRSLDMADSILSETDSSTVELLIGNDYYLDVILSQKIEVQPGLYLLASKLDWILTGRTSEAQSEASQTMMTLT